MPMRNIIITDLDGTLFDNRHRAHLVPPREEWGKTAAWDAFNLACLDDTPICENIDLHNAFSGGNGCVSRILLTSRSVIARAPTIDALHSAGVLFDDLVMRPADEDAPPAYFKVETLMRFSAGVCREDAAFTFMDDDPSVIRMARGMFPSAKIIQVPSLCAHVLANEGVAPCKN